MSFKIVLIHCLAITKLSLCEKYRLAKMKPRNREARGLDAAGILSKLPHIFWNVFIYLMTGLGFLLMGCVAICVVIIAVIGTVRLGTWLSQRLRDWRRRGERGEGADAEELQNLRDHAEPEPHRGHANEEEEEAGRRRSTEGERLADAAAEDDSQHVTKTPPDPVQDR